MKIKILRTGKEGLLSVAWVARFFSMAIADLLQVCSFTRIVQSSLTQAIIRNLKKIAFNCYFLIENLINLKKGCNNVKSPTFLRTEDNYRI